MTKIQDWWELRSPGFGDPPNIGSCLWTFLPSLHWYFKSMWFHSCWARKKAAFDVYYRQKRVQEIWLAHVQALQMVCILRPTLPCFAPLQGECRMMPLDLVIVYTQSVQSKWWHKLHGNGGTRSFIFLSHLEFFSFPPTALLFTMLEILSCSLCPFSVPSQWHVNPSHLSSSGFKIRESSSVLPR